MLGVFLLVLCCAILHATEAWLPLQPSTSRCRRSALLLQPRVLLSSSSSSSSRTAIFADASTTSAPGSALEEESDDDEGDEYEYVEYEALTEAEFVGSEWLVGTNWDWKSDSIEETWVRLIVSEDGKNLCYWGDKSEGKWSLDVSSQFLSISKESLFGKRIWAGVVDDYYYLQGTVRGWTYIQSACVLGQWQAKRLGVDPEEAGVAPWFQTDDDDDDDEGKKVDDSTES